MKRISQRRALLQFFSLAIWMAIAGCGGGSGTAGGGVHPAFSGRIDGGGPQNPISGSNITLYATGTDGYGTGRSSLATATSSSDGSFTLPSYSCPSASRQTYIVATGGDPGLGGGTNSKIGMVALTGPCGALSASTFVVINELTSVAAEYALAQFSDALGDTIGTPSSNPQGLDNAINLAMTNLITSVGTNISNCGIPAAFWANSGATSSNCGGATPAINCDGLDKINSLANIVAGCINSSSSSTQCNTLFANTSSPPGATILTALHTIATSPAANVAAIFAITPPPGVTLFTPALTSAPNDWTLALNYETDLASARGLAIDGNSNVWVPDYGSFYAGTDRLFRFDALGDPVAGSPYSGNGLAAPQAVAINSSGSVWIPNLSPGFGSLSAFTSTASAGSSPFTGNGLGTRKCRN